MNKRYFIAGVIAGIVSGLAVLDLLAGRALMDPDTWRIDD